MGNFNNFMTKIKDLFFIVIHLFIALVLLLGLFYIRLLPRVSRDLWQNINFYQFFLVSFILCCIILNIYNTLKILGYIKIKEPRGYVKRISSWVHQIIDYIYTILANFYDFIWFALESIITKIYKDVYIHYRFLIPLVRSFTNPKYSYYYFVALITIKLLPRIIFVWALFYDVIFCQHFHYTFRCIPLLLIPLLEQVFIFILKDYHKSHILNLASYLEIIPETTTDKHKCFLRVGALEDIQDIPYQAKNFDDFFDNHFYPTDQILVILEKYETWKKTYLPVEYINLLLQAIRLIVYIFILTYGII